MRARRLLGARVLLLAAMLLPAFAHGQAPARDSLHADSVARADSLRRARGDTAHDPNDPVIYHSRHPGRIVTVEHMPGGDVRTTELVFAPIVLYTPETGFGFGAGLVRSSLLGEHDHEQRPNTLQLAFQVTQQTYTAYTVGDLWTRHNDWHITYRAAWGHARQLFYGIGPESPDAGERFEPTLVRVQAAVAKRVASGLYVGLQALGESETVTAQPGLLTSTAVPGQLGRKVVQLGAVAQYDTRDPYYFPEAGNLVLLNAWFANPAFGSEFAYARATLDLRHFESLGGGHVLALQLFADGVVGTIAFDRMPQLGGSTILRGLADGRYRDRGALAVQGEYRSASWHRLGWTTFLSTGVVADTPREVAARDFAVAGGVGLRFALTSSDRFNVRIDRGWSLGNSGTYFTLGEAF